MYQDRNAAGQGPLTDDEFASAFEALTLDPGRFRHGDHVRLAWIYLRRHGLLEAIRRYRDGLVRFAEHHGAAGRYHETVTWAMVVLIHERMAAAPAVDDFGVFTAANPDLMRWRGGAFFDYYGEDVLDSEQARHTFVLPR
jgi:hypothetical protein